MDLLKDSDNDNGRDEDCRNAAHDDVGNNQTMVRGSDHSDRDAMLGLGSAWGLRIIGRFELMGQRLDKLYEHQFPSSPFDLPRFIEDVRERVAMSPPPIKMVESDDEDFPRAGDGNVLHALAMRTEGREFILRALLQQAPELLEGKTESLTPMHVAIEVDNDLFVNTVLEDLQGTEGVQRLLAIEDERCVSCLHLALRRSDRLLGRQVLTTLINKAPQQVWGNKDSRGQTPLHWAVTAPLCTRSHVEIIDATTARCSDALALQNSLGQSVYVLHIKSVERWRQNPYGFQQYPLERPTDESLSVIEDLLGTRTLRYLVESNLSLSPSELQQRCSELLGQGISTRDCEFSRLASKTPPGSRLTCFCSTL